MSGLRKVIKDIIEPVDYQMSKLPTFKKESEQYTTKVSVSTSNPSTQTMEVAVLRADNQKQSETTLTVPVR